MLAKFYEILDMLIRINMYQQTKKIESSWMGVTPWI